MNPLFSLLSMAAISGSVEPGPPQWADPAGGGETMWETITTGATSFISLIGTVGTEVAKSEVALAFLTVTFVGLAIRGFRKTINAFGRGR